MNENDTIAAICTGAGSAVTIIRISGPDALTVGNKIWKATIKLSYKNRRKLLLGKIFSDLKDVGEPALAVYMPKPNSYTGEDVVEVNVHGGIFNAKHLLEKILNVGVRQAEPGEFTYRAFINGKLDLTQAEAVGDLIAASNSMALHLAERQMNGILGRRISSIRKRLIDVLVECESRVDFPEEELDFNLADAYLENLNDLKSKLKVLYETRNEGSIVRDGVRVVIAGRPNSGKSSLMNLLLGYERAITAEFPGTTRDTLEEFVNLRGISVKLIDTAGIRQADNPIEELGIRRTISSLTHSQIIIWILDASLQSLDEECAELEKYIKKHKNIIPVWNKVDLVSKNIKFPKTRIPAIKISVKEQTGIEELLDVFEKMIWQHPFKEEPEIAVSTRHAELLKKVIDLMPNIIKTISSRDWELAASELKAAVSALGNITGEEPNIDLYETIFSRFCIGK